MVKTPNFLSIKIIDFIFCALSRNPTKQLGFKIDDGGKMQHTELTTDLDNTHDSHAHFGVYL